MKELNKKELVSRLMANYTIAKYGLLKCNMAPMDFVDCVEHLVENTHYIIAQVYKDSGDAKSNEIATKTILEYDRRINAFVAGGEQGNFDTSEFKC